MNLSDSGTGKGRIDISRDNGSRREAAETHSRNAPRADRAGSRYIVCGGMLIAASG